MTDDHDREYCAGGWAKAINPARPRLFPKPDPALEALYRSMPDGRWFDALKDQGVRIDDAALIIPSTSMPIASSTGPDDDASRLSQSNANSFETATLTGLPAIICVVTALHAKAVIAHRNMVSLRSSILSSGVISLLQKLKNRLCDESRKGRKS
ncbi:hypothetical protein DXT96_07470 [Agrobacterium sp. ICMP 6402]|uniref:hypothetical protein n=1 Tax=Agrobacterium sp. ICMP 6402 TaxID=2292443 RepID=UPI001297420F|nr:hypothetical protein [Agrobacterium sp. ICMP 6402]MQB09693.1 hypothetical protein [Agrobacterium sp. ICMP 6402]